jgi:antitoxin MazE
MKTNIIAIGNSQGIRIPKIILDQTGLSGEVELEVRDDGLLVKRSRRARDGWDTQFRQMALNNDDEIEIAADSGPVRENWRW